MKAIIVSDTHEDVKAIEKIVDYAKKNDISTIFHAGDLEKGIDKFEGLDLHVVYFSGAVGGLKRDDFYSQVESIKGKIHCNESIFRLEDCLIYMQHDLADKEKEINRDRVRGAKRVLNYLAEEYPDEDLKEYIFFGHTHKLNITKDGLFNDYRKTLPHDVEEQRKEYGKEPVAINPGISFGDANFVVLDTDKDTIEYMTPEKSLLKIDKESDIKHVRSFYDGRYIARLDNGREIYVKDGIRSEEFSKIDEIRRKEEGITELGILTNPTPSGKFQDKHTVELDSNLKTMKKE